jgi:hypothetical protein
VYQWPPKLSTTEHQCHSRAWYWAKGIRLAPSHWQPHRARFRWIVHSKYYATDPISAHCLARWRLNYHIPRTSIFWQLLPEHSDCTCHVVSRGCMQSVRRRRWNQLMYDLSFAAFISNCLPASLGASRLRSLMWGKQRFKVVQLVGTPKRRCVRFFVMQFLPWYIFCSNSVHTDYCRITR